jgi:4-alpha-glucanotransferase
VIEPQYYDYWGNRIETSESTREALLAAMGAAGEVEAKANGLPPVIVVREGESPPAQDDRVGTVRLESGETFHGALSSLPLGYHELRVDAGKHEQKCALIVVPTQCYASPEMADARVLAISTQLYALRSRRNWGIGDFGDLRAFARMTGRAGAHAVGLNPLHELHPSNPQAASPYSPSSRRFLNVLYIDVEKVAEFGESESACSRLKNATFRKRLQELRDTKLVDYAGVAEVKLEILAELHEAFVQGHYGRAGDKRTRAYGSFVRAGGASLERLATYETLAEFFRRRDSRCYGWLDWPREYRSPVSAAVTAFACEHRRRVDFYIYLQWLASQQLTAATTASRRARVAFYCDLAVGVERNGADVWSDQSALVADASLGAPADPLNTLGQNWGLAPFSPIALRRRAYEPFVALLRANMRYAGVLRVDHVMALRRGFWIPRGAPASEGAYVTYPFDEMLGVLALESVRNRCAVVGEDLGTVPEGFRERMHEARALSSRIFYFQREWNGGAYYAPQEYPRVAASSIGTHDLPTLAGWWTGDRNAAEDRFRDRFLVIDAFERAGVLDTEAAQRLRADAQAGGSLNAVAELIAAAHRFLSHTPSMLAVVAIEDVLHETGAVNVPGTFDEHPNWRRKRSLLLESIEADGRLAQTARMF